MIYYLVVGEVTSLVVLTGSLILITLLPYFIKNHKLARLKALYRAKKLLPVSRLNNKVLPTLRK